MPVATLTTPGPIARDTMTGRRAVLIVNPRAGAADDTGARARATLEAAGLELIDISPGDPRDITKAIERDRSEADLLIIGGGDGTISRSLGALIVRDLPVGILPLGTANDLCRTLGIPDDLDAACRVIADGHTAPIDVGRVNDVHFANVASIGLSVDAAHALTDELKRKWGPVAYVISTLRARRSVRPFRVELEWDGKRKKKRCVQVFVGNGRFYGGGMTISDDAQIDAGMLDAYVLSPPRLRDILLLLPALRWGKLRRWAGVRHIRATELQVTTREPMDINTDGEILTETPGRFEIMSGALTVFVPQPGGPGLEA